MNINEFPNNDKSEDVAIVTSDLVNRYIHIFNEIYNEPKFIEARKKFNKINKNIKIPSESIWDDLSIDKVFSVEVYPDNAICVPTKVSRVFSSAAIGEEPIRDKVDTLLTIPYDLYVCANIDKMKEKIREREINSIANNCVRCIAHYRRMSEELLDLRKEVILLKE